MRSYYDEPDGGFLRLPGAALLASLLGGGAFLGGTLGGETALGGMLSFLAPAADAVRGSLPMTNDTVSWGIAGAIAAAIGLLLALILEPRRKGLALVSVLALVLFGLMLSGSPIGEAASDIVDDTILAEAVTAEDPVPAPAAATPSCPDGTFAAEGTCRSCFVTETVRTGPALSLTPVRTEAAWRYAQDDAFARYAAASQRVGASPLSALTVGGDALCTADAALVIGSASSDGPRERNVARARRRAERLADQVRTRCPGLPIFAASLGQSSASVDSETDRAITVLAVTARESAVTAETIESELGHALATGLADAPLLTRLRHFGEDWTWVAGGTGSFRPEPRARPTIERSVLRDEAPARCRGEV